MFQNTPAGGSFVVLVHLLSAVEGRHIYIVACWRNLNSGAELERMVPTIKHLHLHLCNPLPLPSSPPFYPLAPPYAPL